MRAARAKVVKGRIVTRARFPEGAKLTILMDDERPPVSVSPEDEAAIAEGIAEIGSGQGIPLDDFLAKLRRY